MNTVITSLESTFFHLISTSSFDLFLTLVLFGIVFHLKEYKNYLSLFLALSVGTIVGFLLASLNVTSFSYSTIKLGVAFAFIGVGIHNMISNSPNANAVRYNFFALIGLILGTNIELHYTKIFGSGFKFLSFSGYTLGAIVAFLLISFISCILSSLLLMVFKTDRKSFNLAISGIGVGIAIVLIYLRY